MGSKLLEKNRLKAFCITSQMHFLEHLYLFHNAIFSTFLVNVVRVKVEVVSLR